MGKINVKGEVSAAWGRLLPGTEGGGCPCIKAHM